MKYEEYGCFDIDEQQKIDNEVYENKFKIKRKIKEKKGIVKLKPIPLSQLMDQWKPVSYRHHRAHETRHDLV